MSEKIIKVAGLWERGWSTPIMEVDLWQFPLRDFGVQTLYMTPISGIASNKVEERSSLTEILEEADQEGLTVVFVDENGSSSLEEFEHPDKVLYVFGKAGSAATIHARSKDLSISISTVANKGLLWPHQAASIVLYDRHLK